MSAPNFQQVIEKLQPVMDPELNISIVDLGLVRGINIDDTTGDIDIDLSLTSPMCPMGPEIMSASTRAASQAPGANKVHVDLVFAPPWDPRQVATEDGKAALGIWD